MAEVNIKEKGRNIVLNRIQTPDGTILTSYHRHDYKTHIDANGYEYMVDGGNAYLRRTVVDEYPYTELSIYSDAKWDVIRQSFSRGTKGIDGEDPFKWVLLQDMSNEWLVAVIVYIGEEKCANPYNFLAHLYWKEAKYRLLSNIFIAK